MSSDLKRINCIVDSFSKRLADSSPSFSVTCGAKNSTFSLKKAMCIKANHSSVPHVLLFIMDFPWSKITLTAREAHATGAEGQTPGRRHSTPAP